MKPLYVGVLLAAGAVGGAVIMQVARKPQTLPPAPVVAQVRTPPVTAPVTPPVTPPVAPPVVKPPVEPASAPAVVAPAKPSPVEPSKPVRVAPRPAPARRAAVVTPQGRPAMIAPPSEPVAQPVPEPAPPAPVAPPPQPVPPARIEPENATPPPPPAPPEPHRVTLNAGTMLPVRLVDGLTSERNLPGDSFTATLDKELVVDGFVIAERGARVEGQVVASDKGGRVKGISSLEVELVRLHTSDGQAVTIRTDGFARRAEETRRQDAGKVGAGAAIGAVIGAIAGGGKGAAIGAGVGGGAGAGTVMATRGDAATLPSETRVTFRLNAPVTITEKLR